MISKSTIAWRLGVLVLAAAGVPAGLYWHDSQQRVDTEAMLNASVSVTTISHVELDHLGDSVWSSSWGSGFLTSSKDCEVLTNHHVIAGAARVEIYPRLWSKSFGIPATVVNSSPRTDIAILRMTRCDGIPEAPLGDSSDLRPGHEVYAVGNPLGVNPDSITQGIVSHTKRFTSGLIPYLQTDANISRGSSGGALFDRWGKVIGVNTAIIATPNGVSLGVGYALPINLVKAEIEKLHAGPPTWGQAGIEQYLTGLTERESSFFNVPGEHAAVIVTTSPENGPSQGKLFAKDVIYQINDVDVIDVKQAQRLISSFTPGDDVIFKVIRSGGLIEVDVTLEEGWKAKDLPGADHYEGHLGLTLEMWEGDSNVETKFRSPVITQVSSLGPAHLAHITSSQKTLLQNGPVVIPIQLDVKTVTGIVYEGTYHAVDSVGALEHLALQAFADSSPILLEIETWGRSNPMQFNDPIQRQITSFHMVQPALTSVSPPRLEEKKPNHVSLPETMESGATYVAYFESERRR